MSCNNDQEVLKKISKMDKSILVGMAAIPRYEFAIPNIFPILGNNKIVEPKQRNIGFEILGLEKPMCNSCDYMNQKFQRKSICRSCSQFYQDLHSNNRE